MRSELKDLGAGFMQNHRLFAGSFAVFTDNMALQIAMFNPGGKIR
ncbi:hypothetical protein NOR53_1323 [gamma proteobacterium NOR5-3]|nr:hypothetical protein NOR53_1323 [gamma proteobacterium NOR5-3]